MANKTVTVKPSGGDYTSLNAAFAGELAANPNLVSMAGILTIECYAMADTTIATTGTGWTTSSSYYIHVVAVDPPTTGGFDTSKYYLAATGDTLNGALWIRANHTRVTGLQIKASSTATYQSAIGIKNDSTSGVLINRCRVWLDVTHGNNLPTGINNTYATGTVRNTWVYITGGQPTSNIQGASAGISSHQGTTTAQNCTVSGFHNDFSGSASGPLSLTNCVAQSSGAAGYAYTTFSSGSHNLSDRADAPGTTPYNSKTVTFVNAANGDFHLDAADTEARDKGTDLSGTFTDDIDGVTRSGTWDLGADEYVSSSQLSYPASDVAAGTWTPSSGAVLYAMLEDDTDTTYIRSSSGSGSDVATVALDPISLPQAGTVTLRVRHKAV